MRDHDTMTKPGIPDEAEREAAQAHEEPARGIDVHVRNKELRTDLEQEEGCVFFVEPLLVILNKLDDLSLTEAQAVEIRSEAAKDLGEISVLNYLVNTYILLGSGDTGKIALPVHEVAIDTRLEHIIRASNGLRSVGMIEGEGFRARDELGVLAS